MGTLDGFTVRPVGDPIATYTTNAWVVSVHDGDSITVWVDHGDEEYHALDVRLWGVNARELADPGGPEARDHLAAVLPPGTWVTLTSPAKYARDMYGRALRVVGTADHPDLAAWLQEEQWVAGPYFGRGAKPKPVWPRTVTP